jgi:hypothetical protein
MCLYIPLRLAPPFASSSRHVLLSDARFLELAAGANAA